MKNIEAFVIPRFFVIDGDTKRERQAHIAELMRSGRARASDTFVYTGVPRSPGGLNRKQPTKFELVIIRLPLARLA